MASIEDRVLNAVYKHVPYRVFSAVLCLLLVVNQAAILDYYLVIRMGNYYAFFVIGDLLSIAFFLTAFIKSFLYLKKLREGEQVSEVGGELPWGYAAWLVYSLVLAIKVGIIFENFAHVLDERDFFGPNTLKMTIASTCLIFMLLVTVHNDATPKSKRALFLATLTHGVAFNILDSITILDILFEQESHIMLTFKIHKAINFFGCVNLILPFIPLIVLSRTRYGTVEMTTPVHVVHLLASLLALNLPLFIIRLWLWHALHKDISIFLIKNIYGIAMVLKEVWVSCLMPKDDDGKEKGTEMTNMVSRSQPESV